MAAKVKKLIPKGNGSFCSTVPESRAGSGERFQYLNTAKKHSRQITPVRTNRFWRADAFSARPMARAMAYTNTHTPASAASVTAALAGSDGRL